MAPLWGDRTARKINRASTFPYSTRDSFSLRRATVSRLLDLCYSRAVVYISKVYTRFGDAGSTMLVDGSTTSKSDQRVRSYGDIDELNACIGLLRTSLQSAVTTPTTNKDATYQQFHAQIDAELGRIQQELFNLGSELATPNFVADEKRPCVLARHIDRLESEIDAHNKILAPLPSFILPGGGPCASFAHLARTVCRRAERELVELLGQATIRPETLRYVNRLSDYLFVVSRSIAAIQGYEEVLWAPKDT